MNKKNLKIIDTNVICMAGRTDYEKMSTEEAKCAKECTNFIIDFINSPTSVLVLDMQRTILKEYEQNIRIKQPTIASIFLRWLYKKFATMSIEYISLEKDCNEEFKSYPICKELSGFDRNDKKFIAIANAHPLKPTIIQGTDCKWWKYKDILLTLGINVDFLCEEYIIKNYEHKLNT